MNHFKKRWSASIPYSFLTVISRKLCDEDCCRSRSSLSLRPLPLCNFVIGVECANLKADWSVQSTIKNAVYIGCSMALLQVLEYWCVSTEMKSFWFLLRHCKSTLRCTFVNWSVICEQGYFLWMHIETASLPHFYLLTAKLPRSYKIMCKRGVILVKLLLLLFEVLTSFCSLKKRKGLSSLPGSSPDVSLTSRSRYKHIAQRSGGALAVAFHN